MSSSPAGSESRFDSSSSKVSFFHPQFWIAAAAVWTGAVLALALSPNATGGWLMRTLGDKIVHGCAFSVGCLLWAKALQANLRFPRMTTAVAGAVIAVGIGIAVEGLQIYIPARTADPRDIVADVIGVLPALVYLTAVEALSRRHRH